MHRALIRQPLRRRARVQGVLGGSVSQRHGHREGSRVSQAAEVPGPAADAPLLLPGVAEPQRPAPLSHLIGRKEGGPMRSPAVTARVRTSGLEVVMTRKKRSWGDQRGWIVPADGSPPQELPPHMVGHKLISWPGTMPEKQPAEPVKYLASKDYYHRHVLNPEGVSVYVPEGRDAESLPESIKTEIRRQLKGLGNQRS